MEGLLQTIAHYGASLTAVLAVDPVRLSEPDIIARLFLQVLLLLGSAFFSCSGTSLFSLSRLDLQKLRKERHRHAETLYALLDQPRRLIISILCGHELINIAAVANMTGILASLYGEGTTVLVNVFIMVPLLLLLGTVLPKTIAVSNPLRLSTRIVAAPMQFWIRFIAPLRWVIRGLSDRVTTFIIGEKPAAENILQIDEFRTLVEEVVQEGEINATVRTLIHHLLEASDSEVIEIMTPRTRTAFINGDLSVSEMVAQFKLCRHSRVPVYRKNRDNLIGFMHAEDVLHLMFKGTDLASLKPEDILRPPVVVPLTKKVDEMFDFFQHNRARSAAVLNEFGGVEGFITIQDVLNFIFGQISGDVNGQELYRERDTHIYEVSADMRLNDFNNLTNFGIEDPRMTTIGGVAFRHLDRLPRVGDKVNVEGIVITVLAMDGHRMTKVRVARGTDREEAVTEVKTEAERAKKAPGVDQYRDSPEGSIRLEAKETAAEVASEQNVGEEGSHGTQSTEQERSVVVRALDVMEEKGGPQPSNVARLTDRAGAAGSRGIKP